jgi:hypothetical protein
MISSAVTASERVKTIKAITPLLAAETWPLIDLTLRQFKLPTTDNWDGNHRETYVVTMVSDASDSVLIELASHLGIESATRPSSITPSFWLPGHLRMFVTHLAKHKKHAALLQENLLSFQIASFIAHKDIEPTKKWQDEIELALSTADALVALLTPGSHESYWTDQEIGFALGRSLPILAVRLGEDPYGFLAREQAIQGMGVKPDKLAHSVFKVFLKNKQTRKRLAESLVQSFVTSNSFQKAKDNFAALEEIEYWDEHLASAVKAAVKENSQIAEAWGIPEKVKAFLKTMSAKL